MNYSTGIRTHVFGLGLFVGAQRGLLELIDVGQQVGLVLQSQLLVDDVQVPHRVHLALHVRNVIIVERTCRRADTVDEAEELGWVPCPEVRRYLTMLSTAVIME